MTLDRKRVITMIPDKCLDLSTYTWSKSDKDLDKIAKSFGLKNGREIWVSPPNEKIIKYRKKPESLQPGDTFFIPISPEVRKQLRAAGDKYNTTKRAYVAWIEVQERRIVEIEQKINQLYVVVDKLSRRAFDGSEKKAAINQLITVLDPLTAILEPFAKMKVPFGTLRPVENLQVLTGKLKKERLAMKGGDWDANQLEGLKNLIKAFRKDIDTLKIEIDKLESELHMVGLKLVKEWCKIKSVSVFAGLELKGFMK